MKYELRIVSLGTLLETAARCNVVTLETADLPPSASEWLEKVLGGDPPGVFTVTRSGRVVHGYDQLAWLLWAFNPRTDVAWQPGIDRLVSAARNPDAVSLWRTLNLPALLEWAGDSKVRIENGNTVRPWESKIALYEIQD